HRTLELTDPLPALDLGMSHGLCEGQQEPTLDREPDGPYRLLPRPAQIACRRRHHRALLGPAARPGRVPMPAPPNPAHITHCATDGAGEPGNAAFPRIPGQSLVDPAVDVRRRPVPGDLGYVESPKGELEALVLPDGEVVR